MRRARYFNKNTILRDHKRSLSAEFERRFHLCGKTGLNLLQDLHDVAGNSQVCAGYGTRA